MEAPKGKTRRTWGQEGSDGVVGKAVLLFVFCRKRSKEVVATDCQSCGSVTLQIDVITPQKTTSCLIPTETYSEHIRSQKTFVKQQKLLQAA